MAVYPARLPAYLPLPPPPKSSNSPPIFDADECNPHWENAIPDSNLDPRWLEPSAKTHSRPTPPPRLPPKRMSEFEDTILQSKRSGLDHTEYVNDHPHEDDVSPPTTPPSSPPPVPTLAPTHPSAFSTSALRITAPPSASSSAPICQVTTPNSDGSLATKVVPAAAPPSLDPLVPPKPISCLSVTIPVFPVDLVSKLPSRPTKADLMALVDHGFSPAADLLRLHDSDNVTIVPGPLPTFSADGVAAAPPLNILHDKTTNSYALQLHLVVATLSPMVPRFLLQSTIRNLLTHYALIGLSTQAPRVPAHPTSSTLPLTSLAHYPSLWATALHFPSKATVHFLST
ncbi:hypothetical protein AeRB84_020120 [Aphanomyces euteiches]|nr:hypothetical protein AeRB84_020120 [Aphanomyces euteiches]